MYLPLIRQLQKPVGVGGVQLNGQWLVHELVSDPSHAIGPLPRLPIALGRSAASASLEDSRYFSRDIQDNPWWRCECHQITQQ